MLFILFTVLSYPSHLRLAVLKPMALVLNLHHDLQHQRLHPKFMFLKIISVVFLIGGFNFCIINLEMKPYFCICIMTLTFQRSWSRNVAHDHLYRTHEWVQHKVNNFPVGYIHSRRFGFYHR